MLYLIALIVFLIYTSGIFFINNIYILIVILAFNILLMLIFKTPIKKAFYNLYKYSFIVFLTFIFNILFGYFKEAFMISFKLILVCNICFIFS